MIGIVIVTHCALGDEFIAAAEHVVGKQEQMIAIGINADTDIEQARAHIRTSIEKANSGEGVVVFSDMFGGTPSNLAFSMLEKGKVEVIAGVNLPMLIKLAEVRTKTDLTKAVEEAANAGKKYIQVASAFLDGG